VPLDRDHWFEQTVCLIQGIQSLLIIGSSLVSSHFGSSQNHIHWFGSQSSALALAPLKMWPLAEDSLAPNDI
jgi:hypothetical protein